VYFAGHGARGHFASSLTANHEGDGWPLRGLARVKIFVSSSG
jgi:hypothetical protein